MKCRHIITYVVEMTEEEALWIRAMTQNKLRESEGAKEQHIRETIFESLTEILT